MSPTGRVCVLVTQRTCTKHIPCCVWISVVSSAVLLNGVGGAAVSPATTGWKAEESWFDAPQALKISDPLRQPTQHIFQWVPGVRRKAVGSWSLTHPKPGFSELKLITGVRNTECRITWLVGQINSLNLVHRLCPYEIFFIKEINKSRVVD